MDAAPPRHDPRAAPLLVITTQGQRRLVVQGCAVCDRAGVHPGMTLAHARALLKGDVLVADDSPADDLASLRALARWASRWSPIVSTDLFQNNHGRVLHGLLADLTGCEHLFGGENKMVHHVAIALTRLGLVARLAVAGTLGAAWAAARFSPVSSPRPAHPITIVPDGLEAPALSPLPLESLRLEPHALDALHEVSVFTVGELLALPRATLPARCGDGVLRRLDQALARGGVIPETVDRQPDRPDLRIRIDLPGGTTHRESLEAASHDALRRLCAVLEREQHGLRRLDVVYDRVDLPPSAALRVVLHLTRPSRHPHHLWTLLRPRFERLHLGFGVQGIECAASDVAPLGHEQASLPQPGTNDPACTGSFTKEAMGRAGVGVDPELLDVLANRLGHDRVLTVERLASHRPERAFRTRRLRDPHTPTPLEPPSTFRPTRLFDTPLPARVVSLSPDGPVHQVQFDAGARTINRRIIASIGPERIAGEWWRAREPTRDYYRVQDEIGVWWWLFREDPGAWFVHGVWS